MAELGDGERFAAEIAQRFQSFPEEYRLTGVTQSDRHLGNGAYGVVFYGRWHGARVAIKRPHSMLLRDERGHLSALGSRFFEEMLQHRQLRHPHVAQLLGICPPTLRYESPGLVLEYLPVTLRQRYQSAPPLTALQKADIAAGMASGLSYLHSLSTMHRDLTTNNVMLTSPAAVPCSDGEELIHGIRVLSYVAKITDVGESRNLATGASAQYLTRNPGAQVYMAPETQQGSTQASQRAWYSYSADVYTLGVTVMAMIIGREPPDIFVLAREGRGGDVAAMSADDPMRPIVEQCLQEEPANRPTAADVSARLTDVRERQAALVMAEEAEQRRRRAEQEQQQQQSDGDASDGADANVPDAHPLVIERLEGDVRALQATGTELAAEKGQLLEANNQLAALNVQLQAEAERLTAEKDQIQATANQQRAERDQFSDQMRLVEEERDQLSHEKRVVEDEWDQFSDEKRMVEEERDQLSYQMRLVEDERDQFSHENRLLKEERDQLSNQKRLIEEERDQLSNQMRLVEDERDQFSDEKRLVEEERDQLSNQKRLVEDERDQLSNQKRLVEEERDQLSNQNRLVEEERDQLSNQKRQIEAERDQFSHEKQVVENERDQLSNQKRLVEDERDQFTHEKRLLEAELDQLSNQKRLIGEERDQLSNQKQQIEAERDQFFHEKRVVEEERDQLSNQKRLVEGERDQFSHEKRMVEEERDQLSNQKQLVEEERDQMSNQKRLVEEERDQLSNKKRQIEAERDQFSNEKRLVEEERDQLSTQKRLVEEERDQLSCQKRLVEEERHQLSNQKELADIECDRLSTENQRLTAEAQQIRQERDHLRAESRELATKTDRLRADQVILTDNVRRLTNANGDSLRVLLETASRADGIPGMVARCQRLFRKPRGELPHIEGPPKWQVAGRLPASGGYSIHPETIHNGYLYALVRHASQLDRGYSAMRIQLNRLEAGNWEKVPIPGEPFWFGARFFVYGDTLHVLCLPDAAEGPHHLLKLCDGEWKHVTDLPEKKWQASCCLHGSHLFVTGGRKTTPTLTSHISDCSHNVHSYDLAAAAAAGSAWVHWPAIPSIPFNAIPITTASKQLWLMGCQPDPIPLGCEGYSQNWSLDLQKSPENAKWSRPLPDLPASLACSAVINEEVVVVGGAHRSLKRDGLSSSKSVWDCQPPLRDVYMLDNDRSQWLSLPSLNHARHHSTVIFYEGSMYCIGGCDENYKVRQEIETLHV